MLRISTSLSGFVARSCIFRGPQEFHLRAQWRSSHGAVAPISTHPSRGPCFTGSSTYGPSWGCSHGAAALISADPSHVSCRHRELHIRPQWRCSRGAAALSSANPSHVSCPVQSSSYGPSKGARMAPPRVFRHTPHTSRASKGAPPMVATAGASVWCPPPGEDRCRRGAKQIWVG